VARSRRKRNFRIEIIFRESRVERTSRFSVALPLPINFSIRRRRTRVEMQMYRFTVREIRTKSNIALPYRRQDKTRPQGRSIIDRLSLDRRCSADLTLDIGLAIPTCTLITSMARYRAISRLARFFFYCYFFFRRSVPAQAAG